jgi:aspartate carbamoyltransferase catalytic subunit
LGLFEIGRPGIAVHLGGDLVDARQRVRYGMFVRMALIMKLLGAQEPA